MIITKNHSTRPEKSYLWGLTSFQSKDRIAKSNKVRLALSVKEQNIHGAFGILGWVKFEIRQCVVVDDCIYQWNDETTKVQEA